jgi:glutamyl-tRNA reductase
VISCLSVAGCRVPLDLLERLAFARDELSTRLPLLRAASGAHSVAVLSTCQRSEIYASWSDDRDEPALLAALAGDRGVPVAHVADVAVTYAGDDAARHLLRVATGLESFVLGEAEIAGQVRAASAASRQFGGGDVELHRLLNAAVSASRQAHRHTAVAATSRSVASVAIDLALPSLGGSLAGRRVLVVGAGDVASVVVERAAAMHAEVTVCNRTRRHSDRFARAGAHLVDLGTLPECLRDADLAVFATAAPHPLVDAELVRSARDGLATALTLIDLALPRNVDPSVRSMPTVRLIDLADLRAGGAAAAVTFTEHVAEIEAVIEMELARYRRWLAGRSVAVAVRQLRADAHDIARAEISRSGSDLPPDAQAVLERAVTRVARRFAHGATRALLSAAEDGDANLAGLLAGMYASAAGDAHAAHRRGLGPLLDPVRLQVGAGDHSAHESSVHAAHELAM